MNREQFINYLKEHNIPFSVEGLPEGYDGVYVLERKASEMKKKHPIKYKDLFVRYLRVSHFDERTGWAYTRYCGLCQWMRWDVIVRAVNELGA